MNRRGFLTAAGVTVVSTATAVVVAQAPTSPSVSSEPHFDAEKLFVAIKDGYVPTDLEARFLAGEINKIHDFTAIEMWSRLQGNPDALLAVHGYVKSHLLRMARIA